jgi:hypothetical protein
MEGSIAKDMQWKQRDTPSGSSAYVANLSIEYHTDGSIALRDVSESDDGTVQTFRSEQEALQGFQQCLQTGKQRSQGT